MSPFFIFGENILIHSLHFYLEENGRKGVLMCLIPIETFTHFND